MLRAGLLNKAIKLIDNTYVKNEYGEEQPNPTPTEIVTRARVVFKSDNRTDLNNEIVSVGTLEFTIRD